MANCVSAAYFVVDSAEAFQELGCSGSAVPDLQDAHNC